jgi:Ser/Thr protein kinase RdoA (MazF antagonist)
MKERWCIDRAAACGVPGPAALDVGVVEHIAYMLQTFDPGEHVAGSDSNAGHVWRQLGHYARRIHNIGVGGFGDQLSDITPGSAARTWSCSVRYNIEQLCDADPLRRLGVVTAEQSELLRARFEALSNRPFRFGLCHGDLALHNVLVDASGTVSLLDWGCAEAQIVPLYDLIRMMEWQGVDGPALSAFLDGYGLDSMAFESLRADLVDLTVLRAIDLTRWAIDRMPSTLDGHAARARRLVRAHASASG